MHGLHEYYQIKSRKIHRRIEREREKRDEERIGNQGDRLLRRNAIRRSFFSSLLPPAPLLHEKREKIQRGEKKEVDRITQLSPPDDDAKSGTGRQNSLPDSLTIPSSLPPLHLFVPHPEAASSRLMLKCCSRRWFFVETSSSCCLILPQRQQSQPPGTMDRARRDREHA